MSFRTKTTSWSRDLASAPAPPTPSPEHIRPPSKRQQQRQQKEQQQPPQNTQPPQRPQPQPQPQPRPHRELPAPARPGVPTPTAPVRTNTTPQRPVAARPQHDPISPQTPATRRVRPEYDYDDEYDRAHAWRELPYEDSDLVEDMSIGSRSPMNKSEGMEINSPATTVTLESDLPVRMADDDDMSEDLLSLRHLEHRRFVRCLDPDSRWLTLLPNTVSSAVSAPCASHRTLSL